MDGATGSTQDPAKAGKGAPLGEAGEKKASKTVADIWREVQAEQQKFNNIVKVMVGLLIVAAIVAAALAVVSYLRFSDIRDNYDELIARAEAQSRLNAGDGVRAQQRLVNQLLQIREDSEAQRQEAELTRLVDRALSARQAGGPVMSLVDLKAQAIEVAKEHLAGITLNNATSHLISSVERSGAIPLTGPERALLEAALADWRTPRTTTAEMQRLIDVSADPVMKGYGHIGLAKIYNDSTDGVDNPGLTDECAAIIDEVRIAAGLGVEAMGPYLWKGECLRDQGRESDAFDAFASALRVGDVATETLDNIRLAAHGAGTTLVARAARAPDAQLGVDEVSDVFNALSPIKEKVPGLIGAAETEDPLAAAYALLEYAANLRVQRGEGEVGKVYTAENIGFVFVLSERWAEGLAHAQAIDQVLPLAWNLTVLHICAIEMAAADGVSNVDRQYFLSEAERARRTLALMDHRRFGEQELKKLLPVRYDDTVDELVRPARERMENAENMAISYPGTGE